MVNIKYEDLVNTDINNIHDVIMITGYKGSEVVYVTNDNINKLKYLGYTLSEVKLNTNHTYILDRVNMQVHTAQPLEKLGDIATMYNKTEAQIMADNNLKTNKLYIGQQLIIY